MEEKLYRHQQVATLKNIICTCVYYFIIPLTHAVYFYLYVRVDNVMNRRSDIETSGCIHSCVKPHIVTFLRKMITKLQIKYFSSKCGGGLSREITLFMREYFINLARHEVGLRQQI